MKRKKLNSFMGIGAISLAIILVILTIACLAVLTYVSADSEYKLSEKSSGAIDQYYKADAKANQVLAQISSGGKNLKVQDIAAKTGYNVTINTQSQIISFQVPINQKKELQVQVQRSNTGKLKILKWQSENKS